MDIILDSKEFLHNIRSVGIFEKAIKFTRTPVIIFEPMMETYVNNPYYHIFNLGKPPVSIVVSHSIYEGWVHSGEQNKITALKDIEIVEESFSKLMEKYSDEFDDIDFDLGHGSSDSLIELIRKTKNMTREIYYLFDLFIDELLYTKEVSKIEALQKLRMDADTFVAKYIWGTYGKILKVIKDKFKVSDKLLMHSTTQEIIDFISNPNENVLRDENREVVAVVAIDNELIFLEEDTAREIMEFLEKQNPLNNKLKEFSELGSFSGMVGSRGYFRGKVVRLDAKDYDNEGEWEKLAGKKDYVLVTPMTRPELVIYMEKAGAFVTDEGGVTCHAAIIAREMEKPCIVGTGIATESLNDGDFVEVDANKGVVRILEKK